MTLLVTGTGEEDGTLVCAVTDITSRFVATSCSDKSIAIVDLTTGNIVANLAGTCSFFSKGMYVTYYICHALTLISMHYSDYYRGAFLHSPLKKYIRNP